MTKKHLISLANLCKEIKPISPQLIGTSDYGQGLDHGALTQWQFTVEKLADLCAWYNPRFDREKWIDSILADSIVSEASVKGEI